MLFWPLGVPPPFSGPKPGPKWAIRNIGLNSKETAKSNHNGGGGGGEGEIRNIEIAVWNIGSAILLEKPNTIQLVFAWRNHEYSEAGGAIPPAMP